jgi:hypothetical protein
MIMMISIENGNGTPKALFIYLVALCGRNQLGTMIPIYLEHCFTKEHLRN